MTQGVQNSQRERLSNSRSLFVFSHAKTSSNNAPVLQLLFIIIIIVH
jgi:hypothetical protein